ncbi:MAG TPA: polysaccharide biosynthesis protein [Prolixibacteraceae bacterium]|nr:polysaccharide biosynthesis protein [Prolixibacteraceae bacterium]
MTKIVIRHFRIQIFGTHEFLNSIFVLKFTELNPFRKLIGDTAIYGVSSIVGRFLNWWLVPYYTDLFLPEEYGVVTNLYAYVAFLLVILTYGMETGYFRFASRSKDPDKVYSTSQVSLFVTTILFLFIAIVFRNQIAILIGYPDFPEYIWLLATIVAIDAFTSIPFARLRLDNRPLKFAFIKMVNIGLNIGFNLFFLSLCPWILRHYPENPVRYIYSPEIGVGYVFIANLLASFSTLVLLRNEILQMRFSIDKELLKTMLRYSFPILVIGVAGMVNQNIDKILIPFLVPESQNPMFQVGIYGANYKLAVLMNMFIQAFRYAFEPFFFSRSSDDDSQDPQLYATIMKYFLIFGMLIFLGMTLYIDLIKVVAIDVRYHEGLKIVPIILIANLFFGIFFSLSIWFKLKDMTRYGSYIALIGAAITLVLNIVLIPRMGYLGSAIAVLVCFMVMMVITYLWGQKYYFIPYDLKRMAIYFFSGLILYFISFLFNDFSLLIKMLLNTGLFITFLMIMFRLEKQEIFQILKRNKG